MDLSGLNKIYDKYCKQKMVNYILGKRLCSKCGLSLTKGGE